MSDELYDVLIDILKTGIFEASARCQNQRRFECKEAPTACFNYLIGNFNTALVYQTTKILSKSTTAGMIIFIVDVNCQFVLAILRV